MHLPLITSIVNAPGARGSAQGEMSLHPQPQEEELSLQSADRTLKLREAESLSQAAQLVKAPPSQGHFGLGGLHG